MSKMITLMSRDNETFKVEEAVAAVHFQTIKHLIDNGRAADTAIPLPKVTGHILAKIITYCRMHAADADGEDLKFFDEEFMRVDSATVFDLTRAAYYLKIEGLLHLTCKTVADMIKSTGNQRRRQIFDIIKSYITPAEEEAIRKGNQWV